MKNEHECKLCRVALENVTVTAGGETLIENVSLHLHCGQLTALVGPNGAGKTTLIRALLSEVSYSGRIEHKDAGGRDFPRIKTGYVPQQLPFDKQMPVSVCDLLAATMTKRPVWLSVRKGVRAQVKETLAAAQADSLIDRRLGALSGGELQRVLLAMALYPLPDLLILDEPVSGVDQNGLVMFLDTVTKLTAKHHLAILLVSHDWELVRRYADTVILLDKTVRASGTPDEVFSSAEFLKLFPASIVKQQEGGDR